jgi:uncharacterized protein YaeQ
MSFIEGFFGFGLEITNADQGVYETVRVKTPRHELESKQAFYSRMLAFVHAYRDGLEFNGAMLAFDQPTIVQRDITGEILRWIKVGNCDVAALRTVLKHFPGADYRIYLCAEELSQDFAMLVRTLPEARHLQVYNLPLESIYKLAETESSSVNWQVNIVDDQIFMLANGTELTVDIKRQSLEQFFI